MKHLLYRWGIVLIAVIAALFVLFPTMVDWSTGQLDGTPSTTEGFVENFMEYSDTELALRQELRGIDGYLRVDHVHNQRRLYSAHYEREVSDDELLSAVSAAGIDTSNVAVRLIPDGLPISMLTFERWEEIIDGFEADADYATETEGYRYLIVFRDTYLPNPEWSYFEPLTLGLDLQGGLLLQYHVYVERAVQDRLERMQDDVRDRILGVDETAGVEVNHPRGEYYLDVQFDSSDSMGLIDDEFMEFFPNFERADIGGNRIRLTMSEDYIEETQDFAIQQAIETIRSRVDALGVAEPTIARSGANDIVVQLPGIGEEQVDRARDLIGQTAQLRFQMVDDDGTNDFFESFRDELPQGFQLRSAHGGYRTITHRSKEALQQFFETRVPDDRVIGYQHNPIYIDEEEGIIDEARSYWLTFLVYQETEVTGDYIQDARVAIDQQFNNPYVALNFDATGADLFAQTTTENVGQRFAIMLDDEVQSAPVINEPITQGRAQITMGDMQSYTEIQQEAQDLVIILRHGALPAPIEQQFETMVGPTLGQESIDSSIRALFVGSLLVILFMLFYYRRSGGISTIALVLNLTFIMAFLAGLNAVLTLPGIAGIILTVGMAVDANVIIYERIREEWVLGQGFRESINEGFNKAYSAVFDANITTGIAGLVLLQYGTGPIRGFAVTLLIGILCTLFTAVYVTRLLFVEWMDRSKKDELSI